MDKWRGKVALVTGAAAGIGAAIATQLVEQGMIVVGLDIQDDKVKILAESISKTDGQGKLYALKANLRKEEEILEAFDWIEKNLGGVDVLVNNAGLLSTSFMIDGDTENWRAVMEVNVLAVSICTREFLKSMKKRNNEHGHVIMINSVAAHTAQYGRGGMYYASKHGVKVLAMCLRRELAERNSTIKVTCVSPGRTRTDIAGEPQPEMIAMEAADVASAVVNVLSASSVTQICEIILTPVPTQFTLY
uniref:Uncharacterized protein n=1 Tax=Graphocephala atropunctata TaxID=36148 RepID=A0A1B6LV47_9HEMI